MIRKRIIFTVAALSILVAAAGAAWAYGGGGGRHGGQRSLFLLASAAGLTKTQIHTAFQNDATNLKADRTALKNAQTNLSACLASGNDCTSQAQIYLTAKANMSKEVLSVWQGLFKGNPNPQNAATVLQQLEQLQASQKQIFMEAFGGGE